MQGKTKRITFNMMKLLCAFIVVFPVIIAVIVSFQPEMEVLQIPFKLSIKNPTFDNYAYAFKYMNLFGYLKNTVIQIAICLPIQLLFGLLTAYAFSYFEFPLKNALFALILTAMMIPGETVTMTIFKMVVGWGLVDTYAGLTVTGLINVGSVFMFRQVMLSVPMSLYEAARIDGCSKMRYFRSILAPLCKTIVVAEALRSFIGIYNNYLWPLLITTKDDMRTVQTGVAYLMGSAHTGIIMAAVMITLIIPVIIFIFGLEHIMEGMTAGAVKS